MTADAFTHMATVGVKGLENWNAISCRCDDLTVANIVSHCALLVSVSETKTFSTLDGIAVH